MEVSESITTFGELIDMVKPQTQPEFLEISDLLNGPPIKNITCVKRHCSSELTACLGD